MKTVLITGSNGFIGSYMYSCFSKEGYNVKGWDRIETNRCTVVDMTDEAKVKKELGLLKPDIIIHCAGSADVSKSIENPIMDYESNVTVTQYILNAISSVSNYFPTFVFLSSASVYGNPKILPVKEEDRYNPLSPYALHKVMCEQLCIFYAKCHGINVKIARIFSAYGPGLKKQIFWDMHKKYSKYGKLEMFGTGNESRDYIYIDDLAEALISIATKESKYMIFNVASGVETTIKEATEYYAKSVNMDKRKISYNGIIREGDPLNWVADISRLQSLGFATRKTISDGIALFARWADSIEE